MRTPPTPRAAHALLPLLLLMSCDSSSSSDDTATTKGDTTTTCAPTARGGADQSLALGGLVVLDGVESIDCDSNDSTTLTYAWALVSAPVDSAASSNDLTATDVASKVTFQPDVSGTYVAQLVVTDARGVESPPDLVIITIAAGNSAPIADCGGNLTAAVDERVPLDGSGSSDPDGTVSEYAWSLASAPACSGLGAGSVYDGSQVSASIVPDCAGVFVVGLAVSDGSMWSDADYCTVTVASGNSVPVANAGDSATLSPCAPTSFELNGFGSYDPEGSPLTFTWSLLSAPPGSASSDSNFNDPTLANPTFSWDVVGTYTFQLQVSDGETMSPPDVVTYTFQEEGDNTPPFANAGAPQSVTFNADCSTQSYAWTCEECPVQDVELDGSGSSDDDGDNLDYEWSEATRELTFSSRTSAITTAYLPAQVATEGVTNTTTWNVNLTVRDCADASSATVAVTYNCFGERTF